MADGKKKSGRKIKYGRKDTSNYPRAEAQGQVRQTYKNQVRSLSPKSPAERVVGAIRKKATDALYAVFPDYSSPTPSGIDIYSPEGVTDAQKKISLRLAKEAVKKASAQYKKTQANGSNARGK